MSDWNDGGSDVILYTIDVFPTLFEIGESILLNWFDNISLGDARVIGWILLRIVVIAATYYLPADLIDLVTLWSFVRWWSLKLYLWMQLLLQQLMMRLFEGNWRVVAVVVVVMVIDVYERVIVGVIDTSAYAVSI